MQLLCECFLSAAASASRQARAGELSASTSSSSSSSMGPTLSLDSGSSSSHSQPLLPPPHSSSKGTSLFRSALTERQIARDLDLDDDVDDLPPLPPPKPKVPKVWSPDPMQPSESETLVSQGSSACTHTQTHTQYKALRQVNCGLVLADVCMYSYPFMMRPVEPEC